LAPIDAKATMTSIDVLPTEAFKWSEHAPLQTPFPSRPEHRVAVRKILDELAYQDVIDGTAFVVAIGICPLPERLSDRSV
jgi:hypothetical protein